MRYVYADGSGKGPEVEDMITFLSRCLELERRRHTKKLFDMCCVCLSHSTMNVPFVGLGSASQNVIAPNLSSVIRPLQYYLLSLSQDGSFLSREESVSECELLETIGGAALMSN